MNYIYKKRIKALAKRSNLWVAWLTFHIRAIIEGSNALHKEMIGHHDAMEIKQSYRDVLALATTG